MALIKAKFLVNRYLVTKITMFVALGTLKPETGATERKRTEKAENSCNNSRLIKIISQFTSDEFLYEVKVNISLF